MNPSLIHSIEDAENTITTIEKKNIIYSFAYKFHCVINVSRNYTDIPCVEIKHLSQSLLFLSLFYVIISIIQSGVEYLKQHYNFDKYQHTL